LGGDLVRGVCRARGAAGALLIALALAAAAGGCSSGGGKDQRKGPSGSPAARTRPAPRIRSFLGRLIPSPAGALPGAHVSAQIGRQVAALPVERKVAQLLLVGFDGQDANAPFFATLRRMDLGGVVVQRRNYVSAPQLSTLTAGVANAAAGRLHQPPFVLARQEGGEFSAFPDLPPRPAPGELASAADAAAEARKSARSLKALGLNGVLGPDVDVGVSEGDILGPRAFSDDPRDVSAYAGAAVAGYRRAGLLSAPEHFPGIGAAAQSPDDGPTQVGLDMGALERRDLLPFKAAIRADAPAVVVGHASYAPDDFVVPASLSRAIETNLLRGGLSFRGMAIADDLEAGAITAGHSVPQAAVEAVAAGADMVYIGGPQTDWMAAYRALLGAVRSKRIPRTRLDAAVTRVITAKRELGLRNLAKPKPVVPTVPVTPGAPVVPARP
jgi:beta-N-acetylhexosaminidase